MRFSSPPLVCCAATLVLVAAAASGCSKQTASNTTDTVPPASTAPATSTNATPTVGGVPADQHQVEHGKPGTPQDPSASERPLTGQVVIPPGMAPGAAGLTPTPALDQKIAKSERTGGNNKKALAAAYAERGQARLNDDAASPRVKYPAALQDFRRALQLDPANAEAKQSADTIVAIYKSMGRPVPGG